MKKIVYAFAFSLILSGFISCNEKPKKDIIITKMPPKTEISKNPLQVGDYSQSREVEWVGSTYTVEVNRKADSTLTIVKDENGQKYYDNRILVRILRKDGSEFFNRAFTKNDFDAYVDALYKKNSVLLGIVLDKADADNIYLASDEFVPLIVKVSRMGQVTISKDTQLDTSNDPSSIVVEEKEGNSQQEFEDDGV